ncbi:MAG: histidine--tRNA ligase [Actinobacteria bacterium]|nr:histidine--tRNA ligase [Actinomycetota bacterium]
MEYRRIKGTRDILPEEGLIRKRIFSIAENLFLTFGFLPISTPVFEQTELFVRGIGEASDIVQKEMYTFLDRSNRSLTLRPEGTAPVVRAYIENNLSSFRFPSKLFYIMPMYRYERPQKGRLREFWQIGVEVFGAPGPDVDSEVIFLMVEYFKKLGLKNFTTEINTIGCRKCRPLFLDKLVEFLNEHSEDLCSDCRKRIDLNPLRVFDCKNERCITLLKDAPKVSESVCEECLLHFEGVMNHLRMLNVDFEVNPFLVRGLDYYEKTTFEVKSPLLGAQSAIGGGGRYDPLVKECGGEDTPGLGFAIGVERLLMQLEEEGIVPQIEIGTDVYIVSYRGLETKAFEVANQLRKIGIKTEYDYLKRSMKAQFKQADKLGAKVSVIVAPEEHERNLVKLRNMITGEENLVSYDEVVGLIKTMVEKVDERCQ